ncbi:Cell division and transport-associated protein TolA [Roseivivax lentus]|uniref:Cell division and transport-associated protein TolA n=1 Tax=Roseivivax lentus TaxID=633194 RepID=A0A1N7M6M1_9RHOB|nr:hypothetical protein [Roseivivax lentus]SIS81649.1 Cell division and transport-associated protein TolA [Roseivivax lentus]
MTPSLSARKIGQIVSGVGHGVLILWLLFGGIFRPDPDPVRVQDVQVLSSEEFAALSQPAAPPEAASEIDAPVAPEAPEVSPRAPDTAPPPTPRPAPEATPEPAAEAPPEPVLPTPPAEVTDTAPALPQPAPETPAPEIAETPTPDAAPRVAPEPVAPPAPDARVAEEVQDSVSPDAETDAVADVVEQEATSPEEATTEIVTEAERPAAAPTASMRPAARPNRPTPTPAPEPEPEPETQTAQTPDAPEPPDPPEPDAPSGVEAALAEALGGGTTSPQPDLPTGPPMTSGERDALRVAVQNCWIIDPGSPASRVTVVVGFELTEAGRLIPDSLRLIEANGGDETATNVAYRNARSAIIRCEAQRNGFPLPPEKYAQWREIEMVFDPSGMRLR